MSIFFRLKLYGKFQGIPDDLEDREMIAEVLRESGIYDDTVEGSYEKEPYRVVECGFEDGLIRIRTKGDWIFDTLLDAQLSNEFVIQMEMQRVKSWDPMRYSEAFKAGRDCAWELEYSGLEGRPVTRSGEGKYPREWLRFLDIIEAFISDYETEPGDVHVAAEYADGIGGTDSTETIDMVAALAGMGVPEEVVAAGVLHMAAKRERVGIDPDLIKDKYDLPMFQMLDLLGDNEEGYYQREKKRGDYTDEEWRWETVSRVSEEDSVYYREIILAEAFAELSAMRAEELERNGGRVEAADRVKSTDPIGAYYAALVKALKPLDEKENCHRVYKDFVNLYKELFVSYKLDSTGGYLYQTQSDAAGVVLKRGEYDWKTMSDQKIPERAVPVKKELALFIASMWKREADEMLVRDGNQEGSYDVPDLKVLKISIHKFDKDKTKKNRKVVESVMKRMVGSGEQILAAVRTGPEEQELLEKGYIEEAEDIPMSFLGIEDEGEKTFAALFTSMEERGDVPEEDITGVPLEKVMSIVKEMEHIDGIIIDPFTEPFIYTNEQISDFLTLVKAEQIKQDTAS